VHARKEEELIPGQNLSVYATQAAQTTVLKHHRKLNVLHPPQYS